MDDTQRIKLSKLIINELEIETRNEKSPNRFLLPMVSSPSNDNTKFNWFLLGVESKGFCMSYRRLYQRIYTIHKDNRHIMSIVVLKLNGFFCEREKIWTNGIDVSIHLKDSHFSLSNQMIHTSHSNLSSSGECSSNKNFAGLNSAKQLYLSYYFVAQPLRMQAF